MSTSCRALAFAAALACATAASGQVTTPLPGSPVRQAIMDAMRVMAGDDRIYVVRYLKVSGDWAWLDADPRSRNGRNRYEPESALLRRTGRVWRVVDAPCVEETCDPRPKEITRIRRANPSAPAAIFPR